LGPHPLARRTALVLDPELLVELARKLVPLALAGA